MSLTAGIILVLLAAMAYQSLTEVTTPDSTKSTIEPSPASLTAPPSTTSGASSTTPTTLPHTSSSDPPGETTLLPGAVLAGNRIEPELSCDDIAELGGSYAGAAAYWIVEGRPDRMDADGNGLPCETVFPSDDVDAFYNPTVMDIPSGRFCRDLAAEELPLSYAVAYWLLEGAPPRMDADGNGLPCETVYPAEDFDAFFPIVGRWQSFTNSNTIVDLAVAPDGTVWTVGHGGAVHWDPDSGDYRKYLVEDGLTSNAVNGIAITDDGTVWLATTAGASWFDGSTWREAIDGEMLLSVLAGEDGRIWFGGNDQVIVLDEGEWTRFTDENGINYGVTNLVESPDGTLFAYTSGCEGEGCQHAADYPDILRLDDGVWTSIATDIVNGYTMRMNLLVGGGDLMFDPEGLLWATGYEPNLLAFDGMSWTAHTAVAPGTSEADWFYAATIDADGHIWASGHNGLLRFDGSSATTVPSPGESRSILSLAIDDNSGTLWAGTWEGLAAYENGTWTRHRTEDALPSNAIWALSSDGDDLWIGTGEGLSRHSNGEWATYKTETLIDAVSVTSIAITPDTTVWAGNWNSVSWFDGTAWHAEGGPNGGIPFEGSGLYGAPLAAGPDGTVWALERRGGDPMLYNNGEWTEHPPPDVCRRVDAMAVDTDGTLWTLGGCRALCSYDGARWTTHFEGACWDPFWEPEPDVAYPGNALVLTIDPSGRPLVGTDQAGLLLWDGTSWASLDPADSEILEATAMAFGPDGELWVLEYQDEPELQHGSAKRYVLRQRSADGIWRSVPSARLTNVWPNVLAVDDDGAVWIGTHAGLLRYIPSTASRGE